MMGTPSEGSTLDPASIIAHIADGRDLEKWWPVDEAFHAAQRRDPCEEIVVGAVLVQNTGWAHAARATGALKEARLLDLERLATTDASIVEGIIRPAGTPRRKAQTIVLLARYVQDSGGLGRLRAMAADDPDVVREPLLAIHGIGPETADAILNYALDAPVFVVDAYLRRLMVRLGIPSTKNGSAEAAFDPARASYGTIASWWTSQLPGRGARHQAALYRMAHAAIVEHMKDTCRPRAPKCPECPLRSHCGYAQASAREQTV